MELLMKCRLFGWLLLLIDWIGEQYIEQFKLLLFAVWVKNWLCGSTSRHRLFELCIALGLKV